MTSIRKKVLEILPSFLKNKQQPTTMPVQSTPTSCDVPSMLSPTETESKGAAKTAVNFDVTSNYYS